MLRIFKYNYTGEDTVSCASHTGNILHHPRFRANIWAIGGGKGGVGKSLMASSFGVLLSRLGKKVLLIDADLGAANLHTFIGTEGGRFGISNFLKGEVSDIQCVINKTPTPNMDIISGAKDPLDAADIHGNSISRLKEALQKVAYDYVLLDIGPGTSSTMLDILLLADEGIVITTAEPTSIENTYRFIKCVLMRKLKKIVDADESKRLRGHMQKIFDKQNPHCVRTYSDIFEQLLQLDPEEGKKLKTIMSSARLSVIINQLRGSEDKEVGPSVRLACYHYFGIDLGYLGSILYDGCVGDSVRSRKPLSVHYSNSNASKSIEACLHRLVELRATEASQCYKHIKS